MTSVRINDDEARLRAAADQFRASGALGRSITLNRLFDFLLERSLAGSSPKEVEIAQAVLAHGADFDMTADASVRVYVHRLRRKLDGFAGAGGDIGDTLTLPRGEYRLRLASRSPAEIAALPAAAPPRRWRIVLAAMALLLIGGAAGWLSRQGWSATAAEQVAASDLWRPMAHAARPLYVVTGDVYVFGELDPGLRITRLLRDPSFDSRNELDQYLMRHPAEAERYVDLDLSYLPASIAVALRNLVPVLSAVASPAAPRAIIGSQLGAETLRTSNVVYVGQLAGLGILADPLAPISGFQIATTKDALVDRATGRMFRSDWTVVATGGKARRDYGYVAGLAGPSGNRVLIVAGLHDAAVAQMSQVVTTKASADELAARVRGFDKFEALYEVRTVGNIDLGSRLILVRGLPVSRR